MPPGVLLYYHLYPTVFAKVSAEECQLLVQAIFSTGGVCEMPELDKNLDIIWGLIKRLIDNNTANYQQKAQMNSEKGKKGAQKRAENLEAKRQKKIEEASAESLSFDQQAEANEQALSFDQQANNKNNNKNKSNNKNNNKITNAHRLTPMRAALRLLAQLTLRLCARSCQAMCAAFLARRSKPKHP